MPDKYQDIASSTLETQAREWAKTQLSAARFAHTTGVVNTVTELAHKYDLASVDRLRLAGWIHDAAKEADDARLLAEARQLGLPIRPIERQFPALLHGAVALARAQEALDINDPVITTAVLYHTTGHPEMTRADKVFYLADLIEPSRKYKWIVEARRLVNIDLDQALLFAVTYQIRRLLKHGAAVDPRGLELHNKLLADGVPFTWWSPSRD